MVQQATYNILILGALLAENCLPKCFGLPLCKSLHYFLYRSKAYQTVIQVPLWHASSPMRSLKCRFLDDGSLPNVANLPDSKATHQKSFGERFAYGIAG